jgi:hypothetical protein
MGARTDGMKTPLGIDMPYVRHEIDHTHCSGGDGSNRSIDADRAHKCRARGVTKRARREDGWLGPAG